MVVNRESLDKFDLVDEEPECVRLYGGSRDDAVEFAKEIALKESYDLVALNGSEEFVGGNTYKACVEFYRFSGSESEGGLLIRLKDFHSFRLLGLVSDYDWVPAEVSGLDMRGESVRDDVLGVIREHYVFDNDVVVLTDEQQIEEKEYKCECFLGKFSN